MTGLVALTSVVILSVPTGKVLYREGPEVRAAPGSVVKPFTAAALTGNERFVCIGKLNVAGHNLTCTHPSNAGRLDISSALAYSCNNFFARSTARLPEGRIAAEFERFGFTHVGRPQSPDGQILQALGEADIEVTPLELAQAYRQLAKRVHGPISRGLEQAVEFGTAQRAAIPGLKVAGKTGTAPGGYAWFAGYAPADAPQVVVVVLTRQGSGGTDAAPIAARMWRRAVPCEPNQINLAGACIPLEAYVAGVLTGEAATFRSAEALKAMAVAARTFAVRFRGRHQAEGFDFCRTTHCQNFRPETPTTRLSEAADATAGELLWYRGSPAATYYTQDCGGVSEAAQYVWPELHATYLTQHADPYCQRNGRLEWSASFTLDEIQRALADAGIQAEPHDIAISNRTPSGRASQFTINQTSALAASTLRFAIGRDLGWGRMKSEPREVRSTPGRIAFQGFGSGHGAGLCQRGADQMGTEGATYRQILANYYPGTVTGLTARGLSWQMVGGERIDLWTTDVPATQRWIPVAERVLAEAETRAGLHLNFRPRLKIYPNVATFRDATGEPGWVAASTRGRVVRLAPGGASPGTLRHEFWHLIIESNARPGTPLWFREGMAIVMAEGPARPAPQMDAAEMEKGIRDTGNPQQARRAYAAAAARVQADIARLGIQDVVSRLTR